MKLQLKKHRTVDEARRAAYMPLGDQLDAAMKGLAAVRDAGQVDLPVQTLAWLEHCERVKADNPKE